MAKKVVVNKDVCISCGLCTTIAAEVFGFGDDGKEIGRASCRERV